MTEPHNERREQSPSANVFNVETSRFLPWMMLSSILSGFALALSIILLVQVMEVKRELRFAELKVDEYRAALLAAGIDPNPHLKGEMR